MVVMFTTLIPFIVVVYEDILGYKGAGDVVVATSEVVR